MIKAITINGLRIAETGDFLLGKPFKGISQSSRRHSDGDLSGADGGYVSSQLWAKRYISLIGVTNSNCVNHAELRQKLFSALPIRKLLPIFIELVTGERYFTEGYVTDVPSDIENKVFTEFKIDIVCPDYLLYDAGDGVGPDSGWQTAPFGREEQGGYLTPYILPVTWAASSGASIVTNGGLIDVYPQIILSGKFTNPIVTNQTTGDFVKINATTNPGDVIVIDMKRREITLNGGDFIGYRDPSSSWWQLLVGDNEILLTTDTLSDTATGTIRWRNAVEGA